MSRFRVLWIDDQTQKCKKDRKSVERIIEHYGFEPDVEFEDDISEYSLSDPEGKLNKQITARNVDLFVVDYNLKNNVFGSDIIREIRNKNNIYSDIIFYSSDRSSLINAVKKSFDSTSITDYCDGVYIVPLGDEFIGKVDYIIQKIIKSWYNVHSIRGIVLSKASKFEHMVGDIISETYPPCLSTIKEKLAIKAENVTATTTRKWNYVTTTADPVPSILSDPINFNWAVKELLLRELIDCKQIDLPLFGEIVKLFRLRNDFAHNPIHLEDGNLILNKNGILISYTEEDIEEIRQKLMMIEDELNTVHEETKRSKTSAEELAVAN